MTMLKYPLLGALLVCSLATSGSASAQESVDKLFHGKTLTIILPGVPGAGRGDNALPFIEYFAKHIPGNPTVVPQYMPGAGGSIGMNYLYNQAPRDGLTIGSPLSAFVVAQVTGDKSVKYDVSKMSWIGRTADSSQLIYVWHTTGVTSIDDAKKKTVTIGSSGVNSASTILPLILNETLGTKFKIIQGYNGSAAFNLAVERGETDGSMTTWNTVKTNYSQWVKDGKVRVIVQLSLHKNSEIADVPLAMDLASSDADKQLIEFACSSAELGQSFIAPPNVPPRMIDALRRAFDDTMKDPDYIATTKKAHIDLNPLSGEKLDEIVRQTLNVSKDVIARYQKAVSVN